MTSKLDHALALAAKGFRVFPLVPNGKTPAIKAWPEKATTDAAQIERWWANGSDKNIGVATGNGLVVLDVDCKDGKVGHQSFAALDMLHDIPETYTVTTPTGGKHAYFRSSAEIRNSASKIGQDIDVRGIGGFVVGPGSTIGSGRYTDVAEDVGGCPAINALPTTLADAAGRTHREVSEADDSSNRSRIELDTPRAQERATLYLSDAEPAIEGAGGDHHTYKVICAVKDFGISEQTAFELIGLLWNDRCSPPWQPEDLQTKIHNAYAYGDRPIGVSDPAMDFEPVPQTQTTEKLYLQLFDDVDIDYDSNPLIDDYLEEQAMSVIYGESHTGKTFVALDMCLHIAAGRPWNGKQVRQGGVVYVAAEGGRGINKRFKALKKAHGAAGIPMALVPCPINLLGHNNDVKPLIKLIDSAALAMKVPVVLIVIDTASRAMAGANENSSEDMTAFVASIDKIRASTSAHVMVIHHSGKDTAKGARGHSSLRAATDTELEVADNALTIRKQRDGEHGISLGFGLKTVDLGLSKRGKAITSCVVAWAKPGEDFVDVAFTRDEQTYLEAVRGAVGMAGDQAAAGVSMEQIMAAYVDMGGTLTDKSVRRGVVSLETKGALKRIGSMRWSKWVIT